MESRWEKLKQVFQHLDANRDGRWNRDEIEAFAVAVNKDTIAFVANVFRHYGEHIDGEKGLTFRGFICLCFNDESIAERAFHFLACRDRQALLDNHGPAAAWAVAHRYVSDNTLKLVDKLKLQSTAEYAAFVKALGVLKSSWDRWYASPLEAKSNIGYESYLFQDARLSFARARQALEETVSSAIASQHDSTTVSLEAVSLERAARQRQDCGESQKIVFTKCFKWFQFR